MVSRNKRIALRCLLLIVIILCMYYGHASAETILPIPSIDLDLGINGEDGQLVSSLQLLILLTVLSLVPSFLILMTSFTRIVIVLGFLRNSLGTQNTPPNQIILGLALFLTIFLMQPVFAGINEKALQPLLEEEITQEEAYENATIPLKDFMFRQTREKDLALFVSISGSEQPEKKEDISLTTLIPAFVISELKTAFQIGFMIFIPFLIIDMVVASTLMSMGMFMLPPIMISLPFKILLFIMVDGWHLVVKSVVESFN